jgi:DNA-binding beta-propeller fold protein YncE
MRGCKTFVTAETVKVDHMEKHSYSRKKWFLQWIFTVSMAAGTQACLHAQGASANLQKTIDLPTSKQLLPPAPGDPRRVNSLPLSLAASPDGKWIVAINAGYGTYESNYGQSLAVLSVASGAVKDFPDPRVGERAAQTFFSGLAFSPDGTKVYASLASVSAPEGDGHDKVGNGIVVYGFSQGVLTPQGFFKLPMVKLGPGKTSGEQKDGDPKLGIPYPAAIAIVPGARERLLVAENLSDTVVLIDAKSGTIEKSFDLSEADAVPSTYPIALAVTKDGSRAFVALWNASEVAEVNLANGRVTRKVSLLKPSSPIDPGTHPCSLLLDEHEGLLYVALSNRDAVGAIEIGKTAETALMVRGYFDTRLPGQSYFGAEPDALAESADGSRLYAANMASDAVAVFDTHKLHSMAKEKGMTEPIGFVPTEMMPMAMLASGGKLFVATGRGKGTGPNNMPQPAVAGSKRSGSSFTYAPTIDYGSLAMLDEALVESGLKASTDVVLESNRLKAGTEKIAFAGGKSPIKHIIYIIKENRTYDQILGDLSKDGKPVGNGDPSLTMYGADITPNQHQLALQFGVLDNFFDSGEVSGEGHVWSNAAIGTDYLEKTWQIDYRGGEHPYDYEGVVANGYPLLQHIPDVAEPASGYLWTNFAKHGKTVYHFAEYVNSTFCAAKAEKKPRTMDPKQGTTGDAEACAVPFIRPGDPIPAEWGGGKNLWAWNIPRLANNVPTKPELVGHFAPESPDFNLMIPDQIRVNIFLRHLEQWKKDRAAGNDTMPNYIQLRLPNDHTAGTRPGGPSPKSSVADNDLAIGRAVEAISHSAYWDDTAFFILEDDAQNGADHVDAHRSLGIVVSKYSPHAKPGEAAFVDSRFYSTVSMIRTMETVLDVPPMNNNDAFSSLISTLFTGPGDQMAFTADVSNRENGLIYTPNKASAPGAAASMKMDFRHEDHADPNKLNLILWQDAMGSKPAPPQLLVHHKWKKDDDDD